MLGDLPPTSIVTQEEVSQGSDVINGVNDESLAVMVTELEI